MGLDMYLRGSHYNSEHSHEGDIKRPMLENKYKNPRENFEHICTNRIDDDTMNAIRYNFFITDEK